MHKQILSICVSVLLAATAAHQAVAKTMSPSEAHDYLKRHGIALVPDSLPEQLIGGNAEALDALIAAGLNVNAKGSLPQSPLELAAMSCTNPQVDPAVTTHMMDTLLTAGADANAPGMQGLGPLMIAAQQCGALPVKRLIAAGAKLDSRTPQGFTPLSMALITKHYDAAQALIDAGAKLSPEAGQKLTTGSDDERLKALVAKATSGG